MVVRTNTAKLETIPNHVRKDFECGLARDKIEEVSRLIGRGKATLKISVYPWGTEFDVVRAVASGEEREGDSGAVA